MGSLTLAAWVAPARLVQAQPAAIEVAPQAPDSGAPEPREANAPAPGVEGASAAPRVVVPELLEFVEAAYPLDARARGTQGSVVLRLHIDAEGRVTAAEVTEEPAGESFGAAARAAAMSFRFRPASKDGVPVPSRIAYRYDFRLAEPVAPPPSSATFTSGAAASAEPVAQPALTGAPAPDAPAPAGLVAPLDVTVRGKSVAQQLQESARAVKLVSTRRAKQQSADLGQVLARTPGVGVRREAGLGSNVRLSINGLMDDQVRVFFDGVPIEFTEFALGLGNVPVNLVERVEIYSGVVPVSFGADALGGAIHLVGASERGTHASGSYQVGSFGVQRATISAVHADEASGLWGRITGFLDHADNDYPIDVEVPNDVGQVSNARVYRFHDAYRARGASAEIGVRRTPWANRLLLRTFVTEYSKEIQHNAVMTVPYGGVEYAQTNAGGSARYYNAFSDAWLLESVAGYSYTRGNYRDLSSCVYDWFGQCIVQRPQPGERADALGRSGRAHDQLLWQHAVYGRFNLSFLPSAGHRILLSVSPSFATRTGDERRQLDPSARDPLNAERELLSVVNGLEYQLDAFDDRLQNQLFFKQYLQRARAEEEAIGDVLLRRDRDTHRVGFGDGMRYRLTEWLLAKASYEWATRLPRVDEVFGDNALILASLRLEPEVSHNVNLSLAANVDGTRAGSFRAELLGFWREADQLIVLLGDDLFRFYRNVFGARSLGAEASVGWTSPRDHVVLDANATQLSFRNTSEDGLFGAFEGDRVPNRPWRFVNASARLQGHDLFAPGDELALGTHVRYVHEFFRNWESAGLPEFKAVVPSYLLATVLVAYSVQRADSSLSSSIEISNVTDAKARDFFGVQQPGRAFATKLTFAY